MRRFATLGQAVVIAGTLYASPFALTSTARAQAACMEGRLEVFGGYCCWPGQTATAEGRCTGPPRCPGGLVAAGADCVAPAGGSVHAAPAYGGTSDGSFRRAAPPRTDNEVDGARLGGGIAFILIGWVGSGITATIGGSTGTSASSGFGGYSLPSLPSWPFGWLPVLHPFAALNANGTWGIIAGVVGGISALMEIFGLIFAVTGQIGNPRVAATRTGWGVRLGAPSADGGLSLALTF